MSFLLTLLIIWLLYQLLRRLLPWLLMRSFQNRAKNAFDQFARQNGYKTPDPEQPRRTKSGWDNPEKEKKISRDEGEYIDYEEIRVTQSTTTVTEETDSDGSTTIEVDSEQQVIDVEWEDLPPK